MAFITFTLSPSIISLVKPASTANSIDLLHANSSTSSLEFTFGPFAIIATITWSCSLQTIAQTPGPTQLWKNCCNKIQLVSRWWRRLLSFTAWLLCPNDIQLIKSGLSYILQCTLQLSCSSSSGPSDFLHTPHGCASSR